MQEKIDYVKRQLSGMSGNLVDIAYHADVSRGTIYNLLHDVGRPSYKTVGKLWKYLKKMEGKR